MAGLGGGAAMARTLASPLTPLGLLVGSPTTIRRTTDLVSLTSASCRRTSFTRLDDRPALSTWCCRVSGVSPCVFSMLSASTTMRRRQVRRFQLQAARKRRSGRASWSWRSARLSEVAFGIFTVEPPPMLCSGLLDDCRNAVMKLKERSAWAVTTRVLQQLWLLSFVNSLVSPC